MKQRVQIYVLVGLVLLAGYLFFSSHQSVPGVGVLASDVKFVPLNVDEPQLRLDLLAELKELTYKGAHRDIFNPNSVPIVAGYIDSSEGVIVFAGRVERSTGEKLIGAFGSTKVPVSYVPVVSTGTESSPSMPGV